MNRLQEIAFFYKENFENKRFKLIAGKKGNTIELNIWFSAEHFFHLVGLHKLSDIAQLKNKKSLIYKNILDNKLTFETITKSKKYKEIEQRIANFEELQKVLYSKELMIKSLKGFFNTIEADYMLTSKNKKYGYAHLFLRNDSEFVIPVTYIINESNEYLQNNPNKWTVLSIEEIK